MSDVKYYPPRPTSLEQAHEHILNLHDNVYHLQDRIDKMEKAQGEAKSSTMNSIHATPAKPVFTGDIQGIKIAAATDPQTGTGTSHQTGSLKQGDTLRYNATTNQFEFGA